MTPIISPLFRRSWFLAALFCLCAAVICESAPLRVAILSDAKTRPLEELLLVGMQGTGEVTFFERVQLPGLLEEFSFQSLSARAGWSACDVLILLNSFTEKNARQPELVVRVVSTRDLKIMGLWIYPLVESDPAALSARLVARLQPLLAGGKSEDARVVVSLALLKTDSPRYARLMEPFTYRLAAQLQTYPGVGLVERWNVKDPAFEQWLRQTQPSDIRPPDYLVRGSIAEMDFKAGLRLQINGSEVVLAPSPDAVDETAVIAAAAKAIVSVQATNRPAERREIERHEQDARWFWKWSSYDHASAAADTALYLGSKNPETAYIRALANLQPPADRAVTPTPSAETFARALYGLECFLQIPPPGPSAPMEERFRYLRYSEQAVDCSGRLLQALYFSREVLPGTASERDLFRELAEKLVERAWPFYSTFGALPKAYVPLLERVDYYGTNLQMPASLLGYGAFMIADWARLAALYAEWFAEVGRLHDNDPAATVLLQVSAGRISARHPWFADWGGRSPDQAGFAKIVSTLTRHEKAGVRVFAALMPFRKAPLQTEEYRRAAVVWWIWLSKRLAAENEFLARHPTPYTHALLALAGSLAREHREQLKERFPEADWRLCLEKLKEKTPAGSRVEYELQTERLLGGLIEESQESVAPARPVSPEPDFAEVVGFFRSLTFASGSVDDATRIANSRDAAAKTEAWLAQKARQAAEVPAPRLTIDSNPRPLGRSAAAAKPGDAGILVPDKLDLGADYGLPISAATDASGHVWLMFSETLPRSFTWVELDAGVTTILRRVRLENTTESSISCDYDVFGVSAGTLYCATYNRLYVVELGSATWRGFDLQRMAEAAVWLGERRVWVTGQPGLIYEYHPEQRQLTLVSSAMRAPATNRLDGRDAYSVTSMFEQGNEWYAWIDGGKLYKREESAADWREVYDVRRHWTMGQPYPVESLLSGLGSGRSLRGHSENFLAVLLLDQRMGGVMSGKFVQMPFTASLPGGTLGGANEAAFLGDKLWILSTDRNGRLGLGAIQRGTGAQSHRPLAVRESSRLHAFETGFFIPSQSTRAFYYLPRERVDPTYVRTAASPSVHPDEPSRAVLPSAVRTFTNLSGLTIQAEVLDFPEGQVTLRRSDGRIITAGLRLFSAADAAYLENLKTLHERTAKP